MKNIIKLPILALIIILSMDACKGNKSSGGTDSVKSDSTSSQDTTKHADTVLKIDTVKHATDTSDMKTDTVSKTIKNRTIIKKLEVKKATPSEKQ